MPMRRAAVPVLGGVLLVVSLLAGSTTVRAAPARPACPVAPLLASAARTVPTAAGCSAVGRAVAGPGGLIAHVPAAGYGVGVSRPAATGAQVMTVENTGRAVVIASSSTPASASAAPRTAAACSEYQYAFETDRQGHRLAWHSVLRWYLTYATSARAGIVTAHAVAALRAANRNVTTDNNDCGSTARFPGAVGSFQGNTSRYSNVDSRGCTSKFPDGQSTISFGGVASGTTLGTTCFAFRTSGAGHMIEADILIASNRNVYANLPSPCGYRYFDLQSVATHEWGHAYGLAHSGGRDLTMYPAARACNYSMRTLGRGDITGLSTLYP